MKVLVTGGAGFIGSNLVDHLVELNYDVIVIDNLSAGKKENINPSADFINDDIKNHKISKYFKSVDIVFHMAALARVQPSIDDPLYYDSVNVNGTVNVLKCCVDNKVRRLVYSASSSAYGDAAKMPINELDSIDPISPYAVQKYVGEVYCKMFHKVYNLETVSLRYFNVFGERQSIEGAYALVIGVFINQTLNGKPMTIRGNGEQKRDFTYVGDVVRANILASKSEKVGSGEVLNIGSGKNYSINDVANLIGDNKVFVAPVVEPFETLADNSLAKKLLGWSPSVRLEDWIAEYKNKILVK